MKIIFYLPSLSNGGAERVQAVLAQGFAARGCEVIVAVDREATESRHLLGADVRVVLLGGGHVRDVLSLRKLIRRERPDAIVSALGSCNLKATMAAAAAAAVRRLVLTWHGYAVSEPQRLSQLGYRLIPVLSRATAASVAVSEGLKADLVRRFGSAPERTLRIYNPVSVGGVPRGLSAVELAMREPVVLAVGRLLPDKGFLTLLQAFARLQTPGARLVILGEGPQRAALMAEVDRLGLADRVSLPGHVVEPWTFFSRARCFVSASRMESFGLVLVEALAHGLPIVSTDCGAISEVLAAGRFGRLVPVDDAEELARAMDDQLANPGDPAPRMARAAMFSTEAALDEYERLIDGLSLSRPAAA